MNMITRDLLRGPVLWSAAAILLAAIVLASLAVPVLKAMFEGGVDGSAATVEVARLLDDHDHEMALYRSRVTGRYLFHDPPPPPPPPVVYNPSPPPVENDPPRNPSPPPPPKPQAPSTYSGPPILYAVGNRVYFDRPPGVPDDEIGVFSVAEGDEKHGVKVISVAALPKSVRLGHSDGEYDVPLFGEWDPSVGLNDGADSVLENEVAGLEPMADEAPAETEAGADASAPKVDTAEAEQAEEGGVEPEISEEAQGSAGAGETEAQTASTRDPEGQSQDGSGRPTAAGESDPAVNGSAAEAEEGATRESDSDAEDPERDAAPAAEDPPAEAAGEPATEPAAPPPAKPDTPAAKRKPAAPAPEAKPGKSGGTAPPTTPTPPEPAGT